MISEKTLDEVRDSVDLVELIGRTVTLTKSGADRKGLCPFHEEKTPSFSVSPSRKTYKCFGCDRGGDAIRWMQEHERLDFAEAVEQLAAENGITVEYDEPVKRPRSRRRRAKSAGDDRPAGDELVDEAVAESAGDDRPAGDELVDEAVAESAGDDRPAAELRRTRRRADLPPVFDDDTLARLWSLLMDTRARWRGGVKAWAEGRGLGEMAEHIAAAGDVAAVPVGSVAPELRSMIEALRWAPLDIWTPLRRPDGSIADIVRRYIGAGELPDGVSTKTARLRSKTIEREGREPLPPLIARPTETVLFGRLDLAIEAAARGEPIIIVEGDPDYHAAAAACALRGEGVALGVVGKTHRKVASALVLAVQMRRPFIAPGSFDIYVVPDIDVGGGGERAMWSAGVALLDVARVTWCPPVRRVVEGDKVRTVWLRRGDLGDAIQGAADPTAALWEVLKSGRRMLESVDPFEPDDKKAAEALQRWRTAADYELRDAFYRMPLEDLLEYMHWIEPHDEQGKPMDPIALKSIPRLGHEAGMTRATRMLLDWLAFHGVTFVAAKGGRGHFLYDQLDRAELRPRPRSVPRLIKVSSRGEHYEGWLQAVGMLNPADRMGKALDRAIRQAAQRAKGTDLRPWVTADGELTDPRVRVHLHEPCEQVVELRRGPDVVFEGIDCVDFVAQVRPNRGLSILNTSDEVAPIEWVQGASAVQGAKMLWDLIGQYISVSWREKSFAMAWGLLALVREIIPDRPILWATGPSGSGKSFFAKLLLTWLNGAPGTGKFTGAALWDAARTMPIVAIDNGESRHIDTEAEHFLLTVSTTVKRYRRSSESDFGLVIQEGKALVHLSAIGRPWNAELQRRAAQLEHDQRHHVPGLRPSEVIAAVRSARADLWSGVIQAFAQWVLPALVRRENQRWADRIEGGHPLVSMREPIGVMGVIADALCTADPRWGHGGAATVDGWAQVLGDRAADAVRQNDPLTAALDELLWEWNREETTAYGQRRRRALDDGLFQCRPLFKLAPNRLDQARAAAANPEAVDVLTEAEEHGELAPGATRPAVVGCQGTYPQLYRDLQRVVEPRAFKELFPTVDTIGARIGMCAGWTSAHHRRLGRRGLREYRWVSTDVGGTE